MLVLTRRLNQVIMLGDPRSEEAAVVVTAVEVRGDQVRLGITAPRSMPVHRNGVFQVSCLFLNGNCTFRIVKPTALVVAV